MFKFGNGGDGLVSKSAFCKPDPEPRGRRELTPTGCALNFTLSLVECALHPQNVKKKNVVKNILISVVDTSVCPTKLFPFPYGTQNRMHDFHGHCGFVTSTFAH